MKKALIIAVAAMTLAGCNFFNQKKPDDAPTETPPAAVDMGACGFASAEAVTAVLGTPAVDMTPEEMGEYPGKHCAWADADRVSRVDVSILGGDEFQANGVADAAGQFAATVSQLENFGAARDVSGIGDEAKLVGFGARPAATLGGLVVRKGDKVIVYDAKDVSPEALEAFARATAPAI
jgi:hypothetical protein